MQGKGAQTLYSSPVFKREEIEILVLKQFTFIYITVADSSSSAKLRAEYCKYCIA